MIAFLDARLRGAAPLGTVFWRDMFVIGTLVNVVMSAGSMIYFSQNGEMVPFLLMYFAPVPYNLFITYSVWKASHQVGGAWALAAQFLSLCWCVAFVLI